MNSKLAKKLKREIKKSPGKAAALATLLLVATYFWLPLVSGLFGGGETPAVATPAAATATTPAVNVVVAPTATAPQPTYTWKQLAEAIDRDANMKTERFVGERDAFREVAPPKTEEVVEVETVEPSLNEIEIDPADAGFVLTSTIVGPKLRAARINNRTYKLGEMIEAETEADPVKFKLVAVTSRSASLSRNGKKYELKMEKVRPVAAAPAAAAAVAAPAAAPPAGDGTSDTAALDLLRSLSQ